MNKQMTDFDFKAMSWFFKFRDFFQPRGEVLAEVNIEPGFKILDYGCGPGSYAVVAAKLVGEKGMVYALDIHPLAIKQVQKTMARKGLANIEAVLSDCATGLPDESIDVALLYDTLHDLGEPDRVLAELHRVLKPDGILSFSDHHLKENEIISRVTDKDLFKLSKKGEKVYNFAKVH
jgi:ubiquinone/menaquinone biosynthesis C-methylase UbiE